MNETYAYKNRAVFIDVDGVIRHNNASKKDGQYYNTKYGHVDYRTEFFDGLKLLELAGYKLFFVSMQNCIKPQEAIDHGYEPVTYNDIKKVFDRMVWDLSQLGINIIDYKICTTETEDKQEKIDAKTFACNELASEYNINLAKSIGIGDRIADLLSYEKAGIENRIHIICEFGDQISGESYLRAKDGREFDKVIENILGYSECDVISHFLGSDKIKKVWGFEYIIANDVHGYCCKVLEVHPNYQCSLHHHKNKHETFIVLAGVMCLEYQNHIDFYYPGDKIEIERSEDHRFWTPINYPCWFMEVSNYSDDNDCYRTEESRKCVEVK